jgi:hypothetical protein
MNPEVMAMPLSSFDVPVRLMNVLERRRVLTLADLVKLSPADLLAEKNLGRKSVHDARTLVEQTLGVSWETARAEHGAHQIEVAPPSTMKTPAERWDAYGRRFAALAEAPLEQFDFPTRVRSFAGDRRIKTLGQLLAISWEQFSKAQNIGRGTLAATLGVLEAAAARVDLVGPDVIAVADPGAAASGLPPIAEGARWSTLLRQALASLEGNDRIIATQRAGLAGPIPTLAELGECFGVSRERIRQIESRAIDRLRRHLPRSEAVERLRAASTALVVNADEVATREGLFLFEDEEQASLIFFVNDVLGGDVRALVVNHRFVFSRVDRSALTTYLDRLAALLSSASFPADEHTLAAAFAETLELKPDDVRSLFALLDQPLLRHGDRIVGFGSTRDDEIVAKLRSASGPIERAEIEAQFGRGGLPDEAIFLSRGLISLPEKIEGWDRWEQRIPSIARAVIEREGPERQWSTEELVDLLALECELPEWMNAWTLGSMLRHSIDVDYLGRNVVALPMSQRMEVESAETKRIHVAPALEEILRAHGGPMLEEEARAELEKRRGLSRNTWNLLRNRRPFVVLEDAMIGLFPRDVPGGEARATQVLGALHESLSSCQRGFTPADVARFLADLGGIAAGYTPRILRGVARFDGRFRLSVSGALGLAEWDSVRAPSQRELLEELLHAGGGSVSIHEIRARIVASSGEPMSRPQLTSLACSIGARMRGDFMEWSPEMTDHSQVISKALIALPERTAAIFGDIVEGELAMREPVSSDGLSNELARWAATLRERAASDAPHIESAQVDAIEAKARKLIADLPALDVDARALTLAAIRYVVRTDDAESDFLVGGLDDDEAVLRAVASTLP